MTTRALFDSYRDRIGAEARKLEAESGKRRSTNQSCLPNVSQPLTLKPHPETSGYLREANSVDTSSCGQGVEAGKAAAPAGLRVSLAIQVLKRRIQETRRTLEVQSDRLMYLQAVQSNGDAHPDNYTALDELLDILHDTQVI